MVDAGARLQDGDGDPRLQHPPAGSARAAGGCAGLRALTGGVRAASCNGARGPARHQNRPRSGAHLGTSPALVRSAKAESPKPAIVRGAFRAFSPASFAANSDLKPLPLSLTPIGFDRLRISHAHARGRPWALVITK